MLGLTSAFRHENALVRRFIQHFFYKPSVFSVERERVAYELRIKALGTIAAHVGTRFSVISDYAAEHAEKTDNGGVVEKTTVSQRSRRMGSVRA